MAGPRGRRLAPLLVVLVALAGCGPIGGAPAPPRGPAAERHGEQTVTTFERVEDVRARLVAVGDLAALRATDDARGHLAAAEASYRRLSPRVRARDGALDREIVRAFALVDARLTNGTSLERMREPVDALGGQLLDGALAALTSVQARSDPGVEAEVLRRTTAALSGRYAAGAAPAAGRAQRRAFQHAYGLLARAQILARGLVGPLGPEKDAVAMPLAALRFEAYPTGLGPRPRTGAPTGMPPEPTPPPPSPGRVGALSKQVGAALERRFALRTR